MKIDRYEFEEPADALLARIATFHASDKEAEKALARWQAGCLVCVLGLFASFFAVSAMGPLLVPIPVVLGVIGIVTLWKMSHHGEKNLEDRKLESARKVVQVLRADIPAAQPVRLEIDFRDYQSASGRTGAGDYEQTWLKATTALADGNAVALGVGEDVKRKERSKRKYTKVKERIVGEASVDIRLARQYGDAAAAAERLRSLPPPAGYQVADVRGTGRRLHATLRTEPCLRLKHRRGVNEHGRLPTADAALAALRWAYRGLAPGA